MIYNARYKGDKIIGSVLMFEDGKDIKLSQEQTREFNRWNADRHDKIVKECKEGKNGV